MKTNNFLLAKLKVVTGLVGLNRFLPLVAIIRLNSNQTELLAGVSPCLLARSDMLLK